MKDPEPVEPPSAGAGQPMRVCRISATPILSSLLFSLLIALYPGNLRSQDLPVQPDVMSMSLEDLMKVELDQVYGASGYQQNVKDAPSSITIITADEIQRYGYRTLADILRDVPGFYVTSDRAFSYVGVRGFGPPGDYNSRILLLVDGHRMNDSVHGGASLGTDFPIDVDLIERVEVIRGPNSSIYMASALLGIVNVVTKQGRDMKGLSLTGDWASYGTYGGRLSFGRRFDNGLEILLSSSYFDSQGPSRLYFDAFDSPATNNGVAMDANGSQSYQEFAKVSYRGFTLEAAYDSWEQGDPTASFGTIFNDGSERFRFMPGYLDLSYEHNFGADWGYMARLYYDNDRYHGTYPYDASPFGGPSRVLNQDLSNAQGIGVSFAVSKKLPGDQTLTLGSEYRNDFQEDQQNYDSQPYALYFDSHQRANLWAVHIQDDIPIYAGLSLDLGLSYDHYSTFGGTTNPRAGLIYRPFEATTLKLLYAQSFRAPTPFELYYAAQGEMPNTSLRPETARTFEFVWEQSFAKNFRLSASGYYYPVRDLISAVADPGSSAIVYRNNERVDLRGAEIAIKRQSRYGLEVGVSLSLEGARNLNSTTPLSNSPHVLSQADLSMPLFKGKLYASMNLQFVSRRLTLAGNYAGAYVVPNFTLFSRNALRGWDLSASVYNAINEVYGDPASIARQEDIIYQDGRNFRLKFTYHF